jgi:hypothetical protein
MSEQEENIHPGQENKWFALANELRQQNQELIKTIVDLENSLQSKQQSPAEQEVLVLREQLSLSQSKVAELNKELNQLRNQLLREQQFVLSNNLRNSERSRKIQPWGNPQQTSIQKSKNLDLPNFLKGDN